MSTSPTIGTDDFLALEERILRAVEIVRREREARASLEAEVTRLRQRLEGQAKELEQLHRDRETDAAAANSAQTELAALQDERAEVRGRIERMLHQMDELV